MKGLFRYIPPMSSDYAGVCSVLYELGGMVIIHNPSGCVRTYSYIDEPRWFDKQSLIFSSGLCDNDVIFGTGDTLVGQIIALWQNVKSPFIALVGTPIPALIGTDLEEISRKIMDRIPVPVFFYHTTGFGSYTEGVSEAFLSLARHFLSHSIVKVPSSINIVGSTPLDCGSSCYIDAIHQLFERAGIQIIADWSMNGNLEHIGRSTSALANIVISHTGLPLAEYMEEEYGIPYLAVVPVGHYITSYMIEWVSNLREGICHAEGILSREKQNPSLHPDRILIIAEPVLCYSIKQCLVHDGGYTDVVSASLNSIPGNQCLPGLASDYQIQTENDLVRLLNHERFEVIIGDPLYERCLPSRKMVNYIPLPHVALSGHIFAKNKYEYVGDEGYRYLLSHLNQ